MLAARAVYAKYTIFKELIAKTWKAKWFAAAAGRGSSAINILGYTY